MSLFREIETVVWKYTLKPMISCVSMPTGAKVLTAAAQGADICVWAEVDPAAPAVPHQFEVYGTGHPIPAEPMTYVGTAFLHGLVFHVYDHGEGKR